MFQLKIKELEKNKKFRFRLLGVLVMRKLKKMVKDAEANKEADKKKRDQVETRNQADTLVHSTEKTLKEHGDKLPDEDKKKIEEDISSLKASLSADDSDKVKEDIKSLSESAMKLGEAVYKSQQEAQPQQQEKTRVFFFFKM